MSTIPKFTIAAYDRLIERGMFDGPDHRRIELIRGELREISPAGPFHDDLIRILDDWSHKNAPSNAQIRVQCSIGILELDSVPEPDIAWVRSGRYRRQRPQAKDVLLVI